MRHLLAFTLLLVSCGSAQAGPTFAQIIERTIEHMHAMTNVTAVQTMNDGKQYDVLMLSGEQWYRQGAKYHNRLPRGDYWLVPESDVKGFVKPVRGRPLKPRS